MGSTVSSALCRVPLLGHWQGPSLQGGRAGRNVQAVLGNEVAEAAVFRDMNFPFLHSWDSPGSPGGHDEQFPYSSGPWANSPQGLGPWKGGRNFCCGHRALCPPPAWKSGHWGGPCKSMAGSERSC